MAETAIPHSPVIVHHLSNSHLRVNQPPTQEELEIPYEIRKWDCTPEIAAPAELRQIHPLGGSPIIEDGDLVLAESGAIIEYPIAKYGNGRFSPSEAGWTDNLYCMSIFPRVRGYSNAVSRELARLFDSPGPCAAHRSSHLTNGVQWSYFSNDRAKAKNKQQDGVYCTLRRRLVDFFAAGETIKSTDFQMVFALEMWLGGGPELSPVGEHAHKFVETVHARSVIML
ncbi:Glutathione S-transferase, N-terminal domain [Rhizoctonia solani]|uniref:Glutathione S-transferase, N-terminal domain n=1 Tax=Rhizoctonia solani TaxID=456999 RepID=A0A8H7IC71_9AGAM|nr:Glutathione S-transferase, N-terminal domain [Rhizoctonia solani]